MPAYKIINRNNLLILGVLAVAAGLRISLVQRGVLPFNSDEAVVGLMARHILQGEVPVFFYGQAYMGSLDAFLVAVGFFLFGEQVWVIRLIQVLLYLALMVSTYFLGKAVFGEDKTGILAVCLLAIPTVNVVLYTTVSLGGYGEALLIGNLIMLVGLRIADRINNNQEEGIIKYWTALGFFMGMGIWAFGLTLVFTIPTSLFLAYSILEQLRRISQPLTGAGFHPGQPEGLKPVKPGWWVMGCACGFLVGSFPWWSYAFDNGFSQLIAELKGGAIQGVEGLPWVMQIIQHLINLAIFGSTVIFGVRPPWDVKWLGLPMLPIVFVLWCTVILHAIQTLRIKDDYHNKRVLIAGVIFLTILGFIFTPFGADPSGRYFLPLTVPFALFASNFIVELRIRFGKVAYGLAGLLLVYNFWGITQCALESPPGITTQFYSPARIDHRSDQELIDFLLAQGENRGYSNYWVSYPLAFLSSEQLLFVPHLPYHPDFRYTSRDDRYLPYDIQVQLSPRVAYITTHHTELDKLIRKRFSELGISWNEKEIGDFRIFYRLSKLITPEDLNLPTGGS